MESIETDANMRKKLISQIDTETLSLARMCSECKHDLSSESISQDKCILEYARSLSSDLNGQDDDDELLNCVEMEDFDNQKYINFDTDNDSLYAHSLKLEASTTERDDTSGQEGDINDTLDDNWEVSIDVYRNYAKNSFFYDPHDEVSYKVKTSEEDQPSNEDNEALLLANSLGSTKRGHVILNLYETERNFVKDMKIFTRDVKDQITENNILSDNIIENVFGCCKDIYDTHKSWYDNLKLLVKPDKWDPHKTCIGYLFLYYTDRFTEVHSKFIDSYAVVQRLIKKEERINPKYQSFLKYMLRSYDFGRRQIKDFLILPVQRTLRYRIILKDLLRLTPKDHPDAPDVEKSLESISTLITLVNEKKRVEEGAIGLFEAYELTRNCPPTLISSNRSLVYDYNVLDVTTGKICKLFLFTDSLLIAQKYNKSVIQISKDVKPNYLYRFDRWIDLRELLTSEFNKNPESTILRLPLNNIRHHDSLTSPKSLYLKDLIFDFSFDNGAKDRLNFITFLENQINIITECHQH